MEEITHGVDEDAAGRSPFKRLLKTFRPQCEIETVFERMPGHVPKSFCKPLRATEVTSARNLGATRNRVPRRIGPFNLRSRCHTPDYRTKEEHKPPFCTGLSRSGPCRKPYLGGRAALSARSATIPGEKAFGSSNLSIDKPVA